MTHRTPLPSPLPVAGPHCRPPTAHRMVWRQDLGSNLFLWMWRSEMVTPSYRCRHHPSGLRAGRDVIPNSAPLHHDLLLPPFPRRTCPLCALFSALCSMRCRSSHNPASTAAPSGVLCCGCLGSVTAQWRRQLTKARLLWLKIQIYFHSF